MLTAIRNTFANFVGGLTALGAILVFNALYFRIVSEESFGIISLLLTATLLVPALDLGTGRTAGRFLARGLAIEPGGAALRDAVATLQVTNLAIGLGLGTGLALAAPAVATSWLTPLILSPEDVVVAVTLIGANIPLLMQKAYVTACLNGMKRQVLANMLLIAFTLLRGVAGLIALSADDGGLQDFFVYQLAVHAVDAGVSCIVMWRLLPEPDRRTRLDLGVLRSSWRFAVGDGVAALIGTCLAQGDKVLLGALLPLSSYGAYVLISTIASGVTRFTGPFAAAFLPHFVELTALGRKDELRDDYATSTQLLSCVILPIAAVMIAFSPEIVDAVLGKGRAPGPLPLAFGLLVAATTLNSLMHLPHGVQLAAGNSTTALRFTACIAVLYIALITIVTPQIGILGPAVSLFAIYAVTIVLFAQITNRMLGVAGLDWAGRSIFCPGIAAVAVVAIARMVFPAGLKLTDGALWLSVVTLLAIAAALAASARARRALVELGARFRTGRDES